MIPSEIYEIFTLIANDKHVRLSALAVTAFTIILAAFVSPLASLIIYGSYILGYVVCWCLIKYKNSVLGYAQGIASFLHNSNTNKKQLKYSCSICDDLSCKRHQQSKTATPWKHVYIQKELNVAIQQFFNKILKSFISSWYEQFTEDMDFVNELRYCLRYASASLINRFLELDHAQIISHKLLPHLIKHIDDYLYMKQIVKLKHARMNDVIVEYLGSRLHAAVTNRRNELTYLQHLSALLMPQILPDKYLQCKNYSVLIREILAGWVVLPLTDVVADPNIINSLVILGITYKSKKNSRNKRNTERVEFLENFITENDKKSSFATDLNAVKQDVNLLYCFMQFLKKEEHVHLLQFCLDVDEFNNKLLKPDLSKNQLEELHSEAMKLYKEYISKESLNFIGCTDDVITGFESVVKDGVYNVAKLRTSKPLYQAYEHTFNVLENIWLPAFFHSNEFYSYICGSKVTATYNKASISRGRKYYESSQGTVAKISSGLGKIKGALKTNQPIEGSIYSSEATIEDGTVDDIMITDVGSIFRDLSTWRVSILSYQTHNKVVSFCINVQRLDAIDDGGKRHWVVSRKDQDFYTLKAKLVEFHGENEICDSPLPSRKAGSSIDVRMSKYENFLKSLLQKPFLRGSDLLYTFLTAEQEFTILIANSAQSVQDIGNIYQSVAHKLRKEKGQHLDPFMTTFLLSTGKNKSGKFEWAEFGDEVEAKSPWNRKVTYIPKTFRNHIFNDNFGVPFKTLSDTSSTSFNPVGMLQCTFYLLKYIFKVPYYVLKLYAAVCSVAQEAVESFCSILMERKLKSSLCEENLSYLINLLDAVIFYPHAPPSKEDLEQRKQQAFKEVENLLPSFVEKLLGNNFNEGLKILLEILQHPQYNKQLVYNFLDIILVEMYPTLGNQNNSNK